jgi:predicted ribosomally synthesized peptide with nif11-like leader
MSQSELQRLLADAKKDPQLAEAFKSLVGNQDGWFAFANQRGYRVSPADAEALQASRELTDGDLEKVAGGWSIGCDTNTINPTIMCCA